VNILADTSRHSRLTVVAFAAIAAMSPIRGRSLIVLRIAMPLPLPRHSVAP
jgi:hypothetical protein